MEQPNYWQRLAKRRVSRRSLLVAGGTAALGGATALVVGCGGGDGNGNGNGNGNGQSGDPNASPRPGGNVTFGRLLNIGGIDPHIDLTGLDIDAMLYSYLYSWDPIDEELVFNNLAEEFENPDPLTFIFKIRPGVMMQPGDFPGAGEELTSEDVKRSFIRRGTSFTAPDKRFPFKIAGSSNAPDLAPKLFTPEKYLFNFNMTTPFVPAIREMANPTWAITSAKVIEEFGERFGTKSLSQDAYGSGPFMLEEFKGSEKVVLRKNPNYFHKGYPLLDSITHIIITEGSSLLTAFENGAHDVNGSVLTRAEFQEKQDDDRFSVARAFSFFYPCIQFKMKAPFNDIKVREAIDVVLDRDEFINTINDGEGQYNGPIQWVQRKWALPQEELREFYVRDVQKAKQLMSAAGYEDGFDVTMKIPKVTGATFIERSASLIKDHLAEININIQLDEVEVGSYIASTILPGNFDMTFFPNLPYDEPDRPLSFYHTRGVTGTGNWTNYTNPALDKLIDKQSEQFDEEERLQTILEAQRMIIREHGPQITLPFGYQYAARWSYVHFPYELGQAFPDDILPFGCQIWTEEGT
jgi:peptide/nickel transport system substrate-binding protein